MRSGCGGRPEVRGWDGRKPALRSGLQGGNPLICPVPGKLSPQRGRDPRGVREALMKEGTSRVAASRAGGHFSARGASPVPSSPSSETGGSHAGLQGCLTPTGRRGKKGSAFGEVLQSNQDAFVAPRAALCRAQRPSSPCCRRGGSAWSGARGSATRSGPGLCPAQLPVAAATSNHRGRGGSTRLPRTAPRGAAPTHDAHGHHWDESSPAGCPR